MATSDGTGRRSEGFSPFCCCGAGPMGTLRPAFLGLVFFCFTFGFVLLPFFFFTELFWLSDGWHCRLLAEGGGAAFVTPHSSWENYRAGSMWALTCPDLVRTSSHCRWIGAKPRLTDWAHVPKLTRNTTVRLDEWLFVFHSKYRWWAPSPPRKLIPVRRKKNIHQPLGRPRPMVRPLFRLSCRPIWSKTMATRNLLALVRSPHPLPLACFETRTSEFEPLDLISRQLMTFQWRF